LLSWVARHGHRELFLAAVVLVCLAVGAVSTLAGLSLAFGAFIAGLYVAQTPFGPQATSLISPMRDLFIMVFFVSIGLLFDPAVLLEQPLLIGAVIVAILLVKAALTAGSLRVAGVGWPIAIVTGLYIAQIGEFSFVILMSARGAGVIGEPTYQVMIAATILTLIVSPAMFMLAPRVARLMGFERRRVEESLEALGEQDLAGGVIICGYGIIGRHVFKVARDSGRSARVVELNSRTVEQMQTEGVPMIYGDATHPEVLEIAGAHRADCIVITLPDVASAVAATRAARSVAPDARILTRVAYENQREAALAAGANDAIGEEVATTEAIEKALAESAVSK
jgi:CPA2 family monovalent cation:H+ antiporter-2